MAEVKDPDAVATTNVTEDKPTETSTSTSNTTDEKNAAAAADVKNLLAELKAEGSLDQPKEEETNAVDKAEEESKEETAMEPEVKAEEKSESNGVAKVEDLKPETATEPEVKTEEEVETKAAAPEKESKDSETKSDSRDRMGGYGRGSSSRDYNSNRGGKREFRDYQANVKTDFSQVKESSDPDEIRKQVEFYFSNSNLPMDKFLLSKVGGSKNNPVELSVIHSFKRMRHFQPFSAIVDALKTSSVLEVTDNDTCVKRKVPLPEDVTDEFNRDVVRVFEDAAMARSVYVKGFGDEQPSTQFDIEAFFSAYGPTNAIRLRRTSEKIFKGSVFAEFDSEEGKNAFLALDPKPKFNGKDLLIKSKKQYCDEKSEDIQAGRIKPNQQRYAGRDGKRKADDRDRDDDRDWRERRDNDRKSGFRDRNGGRDGGRRGHGGGNRGHKGFGSRGGGRGGSGRNYNDRNSREVPKVRSTATPPDSTGGSPPKAQAPTSSPAIDKKDTATTEVKKEVTENGTGTNAEPASPSKKRAREDDVDEKPAKKADTGEKDGKGKNEAVMAEVAAA